jgi:ABC-type nitrate/sulfonate/bicarbonate transport system ATPase subunit
VLRAVGLCKSYPGGRQVLSAASLDLPAGETLAVVGPSGCGKSTLLYLLCGLAAPDAGQVLLDGRTVSGPSPQISIILQDYGLLPWKTVLANVALGLKIAGVPRRERNTRAAQQLKALGLGGREADFPGQLSGGEQQRVAIARAFACEPKVMLMDEPFSSLDAITREKLQETLLAAWTERRVPFLLVTHSVEEAVFLGRRIVLLAGSPARVRASFDNPVFATPGARVSREAFELAAAVRAAMAEAHDAPPCESSCATC